MSTTGLIFFGVFALPLLVFLVWIMRQDKKKSYIGLIILAILAIVAIAVALRVNSDLVKVQ